MASLSTSVSPAPVAQPTNVDPSSVSIHRSIGLIELSREYKIVSMNETAKRLADVTTGQLPQLTTILGKNAARVVSDLLASPATAEFETELLRKDRKIPVVISTMRSSSSADEKFPLILALRSLVEERTTTAVRERIRASTSANEIFNVTAEEVQKCVDFAHCTASIYDENITQSRVVFSFGRIPISWPSRWFDLSPQRAQWVKDAKRQAIPDLHKFYKDPQYKTVVDQDTLQAMSQLKSAFRIPVVRQGRVMASMNFYRDRYNGFDDEYELDLLHTLPVENALLMALSYLDNEELTFQRDLAQQLAERSGPVMLDKTIAEIIVNRLAQHYDWEAISICRVNRETQRFELQAKTGKESALVDHSFSLGIGEGIMGEVYRTGVPLCIHDVPHNQQYRGMFVKKYKRPMISELCVPVRVGSEIVAMLDIEDSRRNAFAKAEVDTIIELLSKVKAVLERQKNETIINASFEWAPSALFVTTANGMIDKANPTALSTLRYTQEELAGRPLSEVLDPPEIARILLRDSPFRDDVSLIGKDGRRIKVSVASSRLGEMLGSIITARELVSPRRIEELEGLERIFFDIAAQTKVPLALAFSGLAKLKQQFQCGPPPHRDRAAEDLDKIARNLKRAEITYDHLALYDKAAAGGMPVNPVILEAGKLLNTLAVEFPASDTERIKIQGNGLESQITADLYQVSWVLLSMLHYGLRLLPESKDLEVTVKLQRREEKEWVRFALATVVPKPAKHQLRKIDTFIAKVLSDLSLGRQVMDAFVRENGGHLEMPENLQGPVEFAVEFPVSHITG
jgi:PAS domain S-box-containing protein